MIHNDISCDLTVKILTVNKNEPHSRFYILNEADPMLTDMAVKRLKPKDKNLQDRGLAGIEFDPDLKRPANPSHSEPWSNRRPPPRLPLSRDLFDANSRMAKGQSVALGSGRQAAYQQRLLEAGVLE
jgi:hypothetical protein